MRSLFNWNLGSRTLELGKRTLIMGVVNVTPDSFSDGGQFLDCDHAVAHAVPEHGVVLGVTLSKGWGDVLQVDVRMKGDAQGRNRLQRAIEHALQGERHRVRVLQAD